MKITDSSGVRSVTAVVLKMVKSTFMCVCVHELHGWTDMFAVDVDTRRRAACDLVRALCKSFEAPVIQIFSSYVQHMLVVCFLSTLFHSQLALRHSTSSVT